MNGRKFNEPPALKIKQQVRMPRIPLSDCTISNVTWLHGYLSVLPSRLLLK